MPSSLKAVSAESKQFGKKNKHMEQMKGELSWDLH